MQHTLRLFERWLQISSNMAEFTVALLAYFSLVAPGDKQAIRAQQLQDRIAVIKFLLRALGVPASAMAVTLLGPGSVLPADTDTRTLVHVIGPDGPLLGVWTALQPGLHAFQNQPFARPFFN